jgi:dipeptidyl aminopeptidase/acylaminoacyl peptidase
MNLRPYAAPVVVLLAVAAGCGKKPPAGSGDSGWFTEPSAVPVTFPELGPARAIVPGVRFREATVQRGSVPMTVWYYEPDKKAAGKLPLVLVPPAGSTLFVGMNLGDGDRAEHYPYVRAGFAVASFEIDGHVPNLEGASDAAVVQGARAFRASRAGLDNARVALDFVLAKVPGVDPERVYVAGHSSAGTLALLVAEHEPRLKACAAYCACTDVEQRLAPVAADLERQLPGFRDFLRLSSPKTHAAKLTCPLLLFHARDDTTVPPSDSTSFAAQVRATNPRVTLDTTATGGHYDAMIRAGVPKGIELFRQN